MILYQRGGRFPYKSNEELEYARTYPQSGTAEMTMSPIDYAIMLAALGPVAVRSMAAPYTNAMGQTVRTGAGAFAKDVAKEVFAAGAGGVGVATSPGMLRNIVAPAAAAMGGLHATEGGREFMNPPNVDNNKLDTKYGGAGRLYPPSRQDIGL